MKYVVVATTLLICVYELRVSQAKLFFFQPKPKSTMIRTDPIKIANLEKPVQKKKSNRTSSYRKIKKTVKTFAAKERVAVMDATVIPEPPNLTNLMPRLELLPSLELPKLELDTQTEIIEKDKKDIPVLTSDNKLIPAPNENQEKPKKITDKGIFYEIAIPHGQTGNIRTGEFPALILSDADSKGKWQKKIKTSIIVEKNNDAFRCKISSDKSPVSNPAIAFDTGAGNIVFAKSDMVRVSKSYEKQRSIKRFQKKDYATLSIIFRERSSILKSILKKALPVTMAMGSAFAIGGPVAAAVAGPTTLVRSIIKHKMEKNIEKKSQEKED